ncbi:MAG: tRNA threonylcarbamoyladenosine dehydratase [Pseudomonadota bacterium]|nr:tRNA threonylcarbamoyladenosine dehydratase [Pseudomonadota bacterium]
MNTPVQDIHERTRIVIGDEGLHRLAAIHVLIVGLGGVGGFAAEALGRAGIGRLTIVDHDTIHPSNINRQLVALHSTLGASKAELMAERLRDINPQATLRVDTSFLRPETVFELLDGGRFDFVLDCIDSIHCKTALVAGCQQQGIPVISAMGAGGRIDPTRLRIERLDRTHTCPLAKEMRKGLRKLGATLDYPVVYSDEKPLKGLPHAPVDGPNPGRPRSTNGTISWLPGALGLMMAGFAVNHLLAQDTAAT